MKSFYQRTSSVAYVRPGNFWNKTKFACPACGARLYSRRGGANIYDCERYGCGKVYTECGGELEEYNYVGRFEISK